MSLLQFSTMQLVYNGYAQDKEAERRVADDICTVPVDAKTFFGCNEEPFDRSMEICLESYLLVNIMMNALILDLASRALGRRHPGRVLLAAALGGAWAAAIYIPGCGWLGSLPLRILMPALMSFITCGADRVRDLAACTAMTMCMTMLLGGGALMISLTSGGWGWWQLGICLAACGALGLWLTHVRLKRCWGWELDIRITRRGRACRMTALVDTGNRLREPVSGACVLIASERALKPLLPAGFDAGDARLPSRSWRMVYYTTLGEHGCMKCFCPDSVTVRAGRMETTRRDIWVAVYPGSLPGGAQALAPLELSCAPGGAMGRGECRSVDCTHKA